MAKIITLDTSRRKRPTAGTADRGSCFHKQVVAYTACRTVHCAACDMALDPFDVLVDMIKGHVPPDTNREETLLLREVTRRKAAKKKSSPGDDPSSPA